MNSNAIRKQFFDFFEKKNHKIVPSAPLVIKNDPTLMFTNAGMNQFKDYFLGNKAAKDKRVADTQKCLRVSGKHNDLEEVGIDSYHHTMFEMLGNWSFGDYFKEEAIEWAWELLTEVYKLPKDRLYATVFGGDAADGMEADTEAAKFWEKWMPKDRILYCDKKDNFWEMGDTGPCGPCSEIHIDLRPEEERGIIDGKTLVNQDDPQVVEIWNLVFIQFNRKADRSLESLPEKHVDTGMGFERLCMAMQNKLSNYETDVFMPMIELLEKESGKRYTNVYKDDAKKDIAFRVIVDHIRAVSFAIADGQLPSNNKAGYVIRRILRRAVRYYYSFLDVQDPLLYKLVKPLGQQFKDVFPELQKQENFIAKVILSEEKSFLRTIQTGLKRFEMIEPNGTVISGEDAFQLLDTFGFPIDLTTLLASEKGLSIDEKEFDRLLAEQKGRGRQDAAKQFGDWFVLSDEQEVEFVGYDHLFADEMEVIKYRKVTVKKKEQYQVVFNKTPFYPEGGGQIGDSGIVYFGDEKIRVLDTKKENDLIIHFLEKLPEDFSGDVRGFVNEKKRRLTENNHTATHLLHAALKETLGKHVNQKGSLVADKGLRFDFSHFQKMTAEEIAQIERIVNQKIRENIALDEARAIPLAEAKKSGAMMLFGEKYGEKVRMITFDPEFSRELCGGCHVPATGKIGLFKIKVETSVAAGVRRIEALTADKAEEYLNKELEILNEIRGLFKNPKNISQNVAQVVDENKKLKKDLEKALNAQAQNLKADLIKGATQMDGFQLIAAKLPIQDAKAIKSLAYQLKDELGEVVIVFGAVIKDKPQISVTISDNLIKEKKLHAGNLVRELAKEIKGGGGGQAFFASAGGKDASGLDAALAKAKELLC